MSRTLQCHKCRHYVWGALDDDRCAAFLDRIPDAIWLGDVDHEGPVLGDGGIRREPHDPKVGGDVQQRHDAWGKRAVERFAHDADPLGKIVAAVDRSPLDATLDHDSMLAAWRATHDAPAMLLVLLRAGRNAEIARAVSVTSAQLDLEGCDYLDNKGWLGVGLCLSSYQEASSFTNGHAAWSALSSPFGDGYLTTRVQQTLLRNLRRVVPEPPRASEWARPDVAVEGVGPLDDSVVAMRLAPKKASIGVESLALLEPWAAVTNAQGLEAELARELVPGHRLFGRSGLRALARRTDRDDVLFANETLAVVVHLTWAKEPDPALPTVELFASLADWVARRMNADHDAFAGQEPHAFAFEFRCALTIEQMMEKLPEKARWEWTVRDSAWYGDYIWAKDGSTRVRIFAQDEAERFAIQADLVEPDAEAKDWFSTTKALVLEGFLPALEASDVVETTPEYD